MTYLKKPYRIHDEAALDLRLAARWYNERRRGLGAEFVLIVDAAIAKIIETPGRWPLFAAGSRRYILNLWFTSSVDTICRRDSNGTITQFALPTKYNALYGIVYGPDGNIWFVESGSQKIGRLTLN